MSAQLKDSYIVAAVRTPVGKAPRGVFRNVRPDDMLAHVIKGVLAKVPALDPALVEDVIVGCAMPEGAQGMNVARIGLLLAGLPDSVPGVTVNRFCSSGLQTISMAADRIATGQADVIIAGGAESMSMVPLGGKSMSANPEYFSHDEEHVGIAYNMGITAENVANRWQITREQQDIFAFESHQHALAAQNNNWFQEEISPYVKIDRIPELSNDEVKRLEKTVAKDEGPRADTSLDVLAKLKPVFAARGTVTAGNSSQMSDGAGALLLVSEDILKRYNLTPIASLRSYAVAGVPPEIMGIGPSVAIPKALKRLNLSIDDIDWIELNEAFAAQALAVVKEINLPRDKVNPMGGAIALGHPLGATGAIRAATIIHGLKRIKKKYGMVTMCIGTGMGAAGIFEVF
jgi:acetyl-CoA acyltransferase